MVRVSTGVTCKIKSVAMVGFGEDPSTLKLEFWNKKEVMSKGKSSYLGSSGLWLFMEDGCKTTCSRAWQAVNRVVADMEF